MTSENYYNKLSIKELVTLIQKKDDKAIDEYTKRIDSGEIKLKSYTVEELEKIYAERGRI
ncbi:MAG: hypothetical protein A3I68_02240 [Candidatus Melainabacteria bacterium RIFCSPLOWO2_02_FULL_35_15]|nr:MAG: hypothetical protein A3F80_03495 [Candidatus Melainabacteria bacterium RIFCSPLOWO2_12_FULL_35_11]OGI13229.1 MAG: hypothetical protein A3I68_02240 [Candidatus Melainabacteria bacterium RIFCSPLOWO2_02_FULL_35_15]